MSKHGSDYNERYSHFIHEVETDQPKDHTNLYLGIALGILFTLAVATYVVTRVLEQLWF